MGGGAAVGLRKGKKACEHKQNSCGLPLEVLAAFYALSPPFSLPLSPSFPWPFLLADCSLSLLRPTASHSSPVYTEWRLALQRHFFPFSTPILNSWVRGLWWPCTLGAGVCILPQHPWPRWVEVGAWEPSTSQKVNGGAGVVLGGGIDGWWLSAGPNSATCDNRPLRSRSIT